MPEATQAMATPLILGEKSSAQVTDDICAIMERRPTALWWVGVVLSVSVMLVGVAAVAYQVVMGVGVWGLNRTVGWAFDITNFVFWIGIGHAGTLISAILFLLRQRWRTSVNRSAEAMTLVAVLCAGIFPIIHMGRPWLFHWMFPYPNFRGPLWINYRSPLVWDAFAIATYLTISAVFWYVGMLPDLATVRDRVGGVSRRLAGWLSLGWDGSHRTWQRHEMVYVLLAGLATPLVVSVHTIVSFDFATSVIPGWHSTIFPPYFVAGAIFSGLAMVITLMLVARATMGLEDYITHRHIDAMCKPMLVTGSLVCLAYATEFFVAEYSGNQYEQFVFLNRARGPMSWAYWTMVGCNVTGSQLLWFGWVRRNLLVVFLLSIVVNVGMWFERFVIIVTSLHRDFLPSSWATYTPTWVEIATLAGTFGLFFTCFLLFCRFIPVIAISEVKAVVGEDDASAVREADPVEEPAEQTMHATAEELGPGRVMVGEFEREHDLRNATRAAKAAGAHITDTYAPYHVHGLSAAMGLAPTRLPWICLGLGFVGAAAKILFEYWTMSISWPVNVGGKPFESLPAYVPVTFEVMVLFAGLSTVAAFLIVSRMWPGRSAVLVSPHVTNHRFALALAEADTAIDVNHMRALLQRFHAISIEERELGGAT